MAPQRPQGLRVIHTLLWQRRSFEAPSGPACEKHAYYMAETQVLPVPSLGPKTDAQSRFHRRLAAWKSKAPLATTYGTWLVERHIGSHWGAGCLVCERASVNTAWGRGEVRRNITVHHIQRHAQTSVHKRALRKMFPGKLECS